MTNLLAILVSLAMLFTGATAPVAEPVSRTLQVYDITVRHNDEEVVLSPSLALGLMTDGEGAVLDFSVTNGDDTLLPFQALANADGLLLLSDNGETTLKIDAAQIDEMLSGLGDSAGIPADMLSIVTEYIDAYAGIIRLMGDSGRMDEIQQKGDALFDELVDRGEGVEGKLEYNDAVYEVTTYEYDLTGAQLGALADAVYASDEALTNYARAYFKLIHAMPDNETGLNAAESFADLMGLMEGIAIDMHVTESISRDGLDISDCLLRVSGDALENPQEFVVHGVRDEDGKIAEVTGLIALGGMTMDLYMESSQSGGDMQLGMSIALNPTDETAVEDDDEAIIIEVDGEEYEGLVDEVEEDADEDVDEDEDADEDEDEADVEIVEEEEEEPVDGETDSEDAVFLTMDFDINRDDMEQVTTQSLSYTLDVADAKLHAEYGIDGSLTDDGEGEYQMSCEMDIGEESYGLELSASIGDAPIEVRANADGAVSLDDFDPSALISAASADVMKLYSDESVQKAVTMVHDAMVAAAEAEPEALIEAVEEIEPEAEEPSGEMLFGNPQFNWLPEGYKVDAVNADVEYQDVNCTIVNETTGDTIYVDIAASYSVDGINHYALGEDGACTPIEGKILNQEISGGYSIYNMDDGDLAISVFTSENNTTVEDIAHMLSAITF